MRMSNHTSVLATDKIKCERGFLVVSIAVPMYKHNIASVLVVEIRVRVRRRQSASSGLSCIL